MKIINTYSGEKILVDDENYDNLSQFTWYFRTTGNISKKHVFRRHPNKPSQYITMRKQLMPCDPGYVVIYKDENTRNNQKSNLKIITTSELRRQHPPRNGKRYKGFTRNKGDGKPFSVAISVNNKNLVIGHKNTKQDAAQLYDAAIDYLGLKYSYKNFPNKHFPLPKKIKTKFKEIMKNA